MKIKLDENLPQGLKDLLRSGGHDVTNVLEEGLSGVDDLPVLQSATREGRLLMTFDIDFADIRRYPLGSHGGIVVFRLHDQQLKALEDPVRKLMTIVGLEELEGGLAIVREERIRYRRAKKKMSDS